jgi:large subunit ribosomal protein L45
MVHGLETKTIRWKFVQSLEAPRVVHVRTTEIMSKDNLYAQVTVRFHSQQVGGIHALIPINICQLLLQDLQSKKC